jgi:glucuronate isomerase
MESAQSVINTFAPNAQYYIEQSECTEDVHEVKDVCGTKIDTHSTLYCVK